ncbi:hypothetical protein [Streptomyces clavuligerus]|uniref:Secreted protein n=1 Tax=Streptomyces clavuligerus TaxID=1901 RepID=D5SKT2_STRCL|nr:hypothetical protein [Streptomyces clavuligerus]ANW22421.1 hypothetical protein BB341_29305 [Streptomyces clavuligerus]EFG04525.1 Hypothetical protein SCLAV_p1039 [Streptomyces clavuligerus]MBY6307024.1 hypothetical protein [Streptomyces clavuligerus]QPJ97562.1 hypothetical protein GE265_31345 [Streptomyces clavuligerus]QPL67081.1 hypothetical protein I3J04_29415 [Streptomyces clavuligerus]
MPDELSAARTQRNRTWGVRGAALLAAPLSVVALSGPAPAAPEPQPKPKAVSCVGETSAPVKVTGGTLSWCTVSIDGEPGQRLIFTNPNRAYANLSVVVYDCDGGKGTEATPQACAENLTGTYNVVWPVVKSKQSVSVDLQLSHPGAQVWWTADKPSGASDLTFLGTPWNS